jgi:hypothetical protein
MFFDLIPFFYALLFAVVAEIAAFRPSYTIFLIFILPLLALWSAHKTTRRFLHSIIPIVFAFSSIVLMYLIAPFIEREVFLALAGFIYYLTFLGLHRLKDYSKDETARGMIAAGASAAIFLFYSGAYGFYLNYNIPIWLLMFAFLLITFSVSFQLLSLLKNERRLVFIYSLILGMIMAEVAWVINFWPFGYLTTGVISLIFYYVLWDLTQSHFLDKLSQKRVIANVVFFALLIGMILASSSWLPVV